MDLRIVGIDDHGSRTELPYRPEPAAAGPGSVEEALAEARQRFSDVASSVLRMLSGSSVTDGEFIDLLYGYIAAYECYRKINPHGLPKTLAAVADLAASRDQEVESARRVLNRRWGPDFAMQTIAEGSMRMVAAVLDGNRSQESKAHDRMIEGIRRHLDALEMAREERVAEARILAARRKTERLLLWDPNASAFDRGPDGRGVRLLVRDPESGPTSEQIETAERRLAAVGFEIRTEGNAVSYRLMPRPDVLLMADPSTAGRTVVTAYTLRKNTKNKWDDAGSFHILDRTKDWPAKFHELMEGKLARIDEKKSRTSRA